MSDIFIKNASQGFAGWRKASRIWSKTSGSGSTGWREATSIWIKNATQWLKVWPTSGIFATRVPFISDFSSDTYANRLTTASKLRIGTSYFGDNAIWDLNGFSASSYSYKWKLYDEFGTDLGITLRSGTGAGWTSSTGEDQLPTSVWTATNSTNSDLQYLGFEVTANSSSGATYNGVSVSSKIKVIREIPLNISASLTGTAAVGNTLSFGSSWNITEAYRPTAARATIAWYKSTSNTNIYSGGSRVEITRAFGSYSITLQESDNVEGHYIIAEESVYNSGSDNDLGYSVAVNGQNQVTRVTTSVVAAGPSEFFWSILNSPTPVTTPAAPTLTQNLNTVYVDFTSAYPADTSEYLVRMSGAATGTTNFGVGLANSFGFGKVYNPPVGPYEAYVDLLPSANNSPLSAYVTATGTTRRAIVVWGASTNANSYKINYTISGATTGNGTFTTEAITDTFYYINTTANGLNGGTVTVNSVTAYTAGNGTGGSKVGTVDLGPSTTPSYSTADGPTTTNNFTYISVGAPTSLTSSVATGSIVLTFSGGSGTQYDLFYDNTNSRPADGAAFSDFPNVTSPYTASTLTSRDIPRYFWIRKSTGSIYSNWYPAGATGSATGVFARLPLLAPNPPRTLTVSDITSTNITLNWLSSNAADSTHDAVASYDYYTSTTNSVPATPAGNTTGNSVSFTYTASTTPQTQYFWVKAKGATPDFATSQAVGAVSATPTALVVKKAAETKKIVPLGITVTSGSTIAYVSTNGFIGINSDPASAIGIPTTGRYLNLFASDMLQTALFTKATETTYSIRYQGHRLGASSQNIDYEIKFTFGSTSAEVYIITNNYPDNAVLDSVLINNNVTVNNWSGLNNSTMTEVATTANSTNNNVDDNRTAISLTAPILNLTTSPVYGTATSATGGFTASISTAANPSGGTYAAFSVNPAGTTYSVNSTSGAVTVSGLGNSVSATVTSSYTLSGYNTVYQSVTGTSSAAAAATRLSTPATPTASRNFTDKIRVSWAAVSNAASYGVWYRGGAPSLDSSPDFPTTTSLFLDDTSVSSGGERAYDVQAYPASGSTLYLKSQWGGPSNLGLRATAPATPPPVLSSISGNNSLALGGTFSWSFTNSPTAYSVFCLGPTGTVFTTSNAYSYTGTTFRPGYDGTGWQGAGNYTINVSARNAGGDSAVASVTTFMS